MLTLAADASLPLLSVALLDGPTLLGAVALQGKGSRNEKLLPAIDWLLAENNIDRHSIEIFAVTRGPGSFTGVRIGLATMQGLAMALGKTVIAMSTHEAIAFVPSPPAPLPASGARGASDSSSPRPAAAGRGAGGEGRLTIVDDAGRGEYYVSVFENGIEIVAPHLAKEIPDAHLRAGDFNNVSIGCARRAQQIVAAGEQDRYADVTPIYVRLAEAEVKLQQKRNE